MRSLDTFPLLRVTPACLLVFESLEFLSTDDLSFYSRKNITLVSFSPSVSTTRLIFACIKCTKFLL
jgi:hypothetical protein